MPMAAAAFDVFLQSYFEDNPRDLQLLRHDKSLHTARIQPHLQHVPDYLGGYYCLGRLECFTGGAHRKKITPCNVIVNNRVRYSHFLRKLDF